MKFILNNKTYFDTKKNIYLNFSNMIKKKYIKVNI